MMKDTLRLLEFEKIIDNIATFAHSSATTPLVYALAPLGAKNAIEFRLALIAEIRCLALAGIRLPLAPYEDIAAIIERARPAGSLLATDELARLVPILQVSDKIKKLLDYRSDIPLLRQISTDVNSFPDILEPLLQTIAPDGGLLDTASNLLFTLRKNQRHLLARVRKRLEEIVREREVAIFLQDDFITQRNGRWVIPVRMDSKGMVPGVVHDVSRSGETAFMEPIEIIGMVNELENLTAEEKAEQIRILKEITAWIREDADALLANFHAVVNLDFLNSIASFADSVGAQNPQIADRMTLKIHEGYHPLLLLMDAGSSVKSVVPIDVRIGEEVDIRTLLITGPNTGGKTIAIKVAGLLTLMAQAGIPVPADSRSVFPATAKIVADIGDEQSIEASLSTFSAHIRKITAILAAADQQTLVLLDELGTGTDPLQGGALACATLEELMKRGSLVLATTHLIDIVTFVQKTAGMMNAAMEFDQKSLTPLYRLTMGEPGQSHALDIARRCGMPERIIEAATLFAGKMETEFHALLADLKRSRQESELLRADLHARENQVAAQEKKLEATLKSLNEVRRETKAKGLTDAKALVNAARGEINRILEIARKERSRAAFSSLTSLEAKLDAQLDEISPKPQLDRDSLQPGASVYVKTLGSNATVLTVDSKHERLRLSAGNLEVEVPFSAVSAAESTIRAVKSPRKFRLSDEQPVSPELNLIGWRVEEALLELDKFLDSSLLNGLHELRIIHGIGTGNLLRGIRKYLAGSPHVECYRSGEGFEGREGITIVTMRA
jgi:DNA mismatch repair protein MutS2